jgi:WD40 repeat protein
MDRARVAIDAGLTSRAMELLASYQNQEPGSPDLRGFEWFYLRGLCSGGTRTIEAGGGVICVSASRDGRLLAGALESRTRQKPTTLRIWDEPTGRAVHTLEGHRGRINRVAFNPEGTRLASASDDGTVRVWDTTTGKPIVVFSGHEGVVNGVAFHPDGRRIASCGGKPGPLSRAQGGQVKLWHSETGQELVQVEGHKGVATAVAFSPDGTQLATGSNESSLGDQFDRDGLPVPRKPAPPGSGQSGEVEQWGAVKIWNSNTGRLDVAVPKYGKRLVSLAFSPDGSRLAACSESAPVTFFDPATGRKLAEVQGTSSVHADGGYELAFLSPSLLAMAVLDKETIQLVDVSTGQTVKTLRGHTGFVCGAVPGPGGHSLVSGSFDGTLRFWNLDEREGPQVVDSRPVPVTRVAYSRDGRWLATAGGQGPIALVDLRNGAAVVKFEGNGLPVTGLDFSPNGKWLACGTDWFTKPTGVTVWNLATQEPRFTIAPDTRIGEQQSRTGGLVAFHPDGRTLACAGGLSGGSIRVVDVESGQLQHGWGGRWGPVRSLGYSPDGRLLASGYRDHVVALRDTRSGELLRTLDCKEGTVEGLSFSPDNRLLAHVNGERNVFLWSVADGRLIRELTGHTRKVYATAFSPNGKRLASVGLEVKLWDPVSFQDLLTLPAPRQTGWSLSWSPDGRNLAVSGGLPHSPGEAQVWGIGP